MNEQLHLKNIRNVLVRLEETIIFALLERAQFRLNARVYVPGAFGAAVGARCLTEYLLHETEKVHARMRRYTSPDEHPFNGDLPAPVLAAVANPENPLATNQVNVNTSIYKHYTEVLLPRLCREGDDAQYGSTAVCDVACLQALSKRIHYGKFVAESKYRSSPELYDRLIANHDYAAVGREITDDAVEARLFERVGVKAGSYSSMLPDQELARAFPETLIWLYREFVVPLTKKVEVDYLFQHGKAD